MSRITIRDIAKLLGVHPSTVSRALKDHPDIGSTMKKKIQEVATELGYHPNYQAINFRQRKSKLIALILTEVGRFFSPDMIRAIEGIAKARGYSFVIFQSNDSLEKEKECIDLCRSFGIEGLLVSLSKETKSLEHFQVLTQNDIPLVFVDKVIQEEKNAIVVINDFKAAYTAVNHLAKKKYQNIAGVFASDNLMITQQRKAGFQAALEKHELNYNEQYCVFANTPSEAIVFFKKLMQQKKKPDAVFVMTDELLAAIIQVIYEEGLMVPKDIAIIAISNGYFPYYTNPQITHIKHSGYSVGQAATNLLLDLIKNPKMDIQKQLELEAYLVELDSC